MYPFHRHTVCLVAGLALSACGGPRECKADDASSCPSDLVCEAIQNREKPLCVPPVQLEGKVIELASGAAIESAEVAAMDINGAPASGVATSAADGTYRLRLPSVRSDEKGTPVARRVTLRAAAKGFESFPRGIRPALPLDTASAKAASDGKPWVVTSNLTELGLLRLITPYPSVAGTVELGGAAGALVVVEGNGRVYTTPSDLTGAFRVFNVEPGAGYKAAAYVRGANFQSVEVTVSAGTDLMGVAIKRTTAPTATLSGTVQLVAGANGAGTSVVVVVESTFNPSLLRGEMPPGLRAPESGTAPNITGAWSIGGVPDGRYVVLAAFENDGNVRDPDPSISGTQLAHVVVSSGSASLSPAFKVTGAIQMVGPGAEAVEQVTGTPVFAWKPYASARTYALTVIDAKGTTIWEKANVADTKTATGNIEVPFGGAALAVGGTYQWHALARGNQGNPISSTEELRGVFVVR